MITSGHLIRSVLRKVFFQLIYKNDNWLKIYRRNITSQNGEDGILWEIFKVINVENGWCVEFGAWDGKHFSNTWSLINLNKWKAVLIEADKDKFNHLHQIYKSTPGVFCVNRFVGMQGEQLLDKILSETPIPISFDLLSVDIDGFDYHVWQSLKVYKPKVVVIEVNSSYPPNVDIIHSEKEPSGSSINAMINLGKAKGYELLSHIGNCIFVRKDLLPLFKIKDNSPHNLFEDEWLLENKSKLGKKIKRKLVRTLL